MAVDIASCRIGEIRPANTVSGVHSRVGEG